VSLCMLTTPKRCVRQYHPLAAPGPLQTAARPNGTKNQEERALAPASTFKLHLNNLLALTPN